MLNFSIFMSHIAANLKSIGPNHETKNWDNLHHGRSMSGHQDTSLKTGMNGIPMFIGLLIARVLENMGPYFKTLYV